MKSSAEEKSGEFGGRILKKEIKKIDEVRELGKFLKLRVAEKTIYILERFDKASEVAQNAFLKLLEEPQERIGFVLTTESEDGVLPTIRSRCLVIKTGGKRMLDQKKIDKVDAFIKKSGGEQMIEIGKLRKREEAVEFLESVLVAGRELMKEDGLEPEVLEKAQLTLDNINRNGNVALQLTNFVVKIA